MSSAVQRSIAPMRSRRTSPAQRPSATGRQSPANPTEMIATLSLHDGKSASNPTTLLAPPREGEPRSAAIRFGEVDTQSNGPLSFTFGEMYNVTRQPSPQPSPQPPPGPPARRDEQRTPPFSFSPQSNSSTESQKSIVRLMDAPVVSPSESATPYSVNSEIAPDEPFFDFRFQAALVKGINLAKRVANTLSWDHVESGQDQDLKRLWNDAKRLNNFQTSDTRTVAVLGDTGEGKSSLINSLLHCPEIAKTGDNGTACTAVVTEYHQKTKEHQAPITIHVEYLSSSEIEELIEELVWSYRQLYDANIEDASKEDYKRYEAESERAWAALEAAFSDRTEFGKNLLRDQSAGAADKIVTKLLVWSRSLEWPEGGSNGVWKSTAETADECCDQTSVFMQDRIWPFTKVIRIYLSAQILKTGIILADLPGLHDTNLARVRATEQYLLKCDHIFTVAGISRAINDQSLKSSIYTSISQYVPNEWENSAGKDLNVSVVCTKTEVINVKTSRKEFCGVGKRINPGVMDALDQQIEQARIAGSRTLRKELELRRKSLLMSARNDFVTEGLQRNYSKKVPGGRLEVFCVSNTDYETFSANGNVDMVNASGIPALRRFCHTITAKAQYFEAKKFLHSTLPSLLTSTRLWVEKGRENDDVLDGKSKQEVFEGFGTMCKGIESAFEGTTDKFLQSLRDQLLALTENRNAYWEREAEQRSNKWNSWHTTQYNAWCKNNGTHCTEKRGYVCWNSEITWKMRSELEYAWDTLEEEIPELFEDLALLITANLAAFVSLFDDIDGPSTFADGIGSRIRDIEYILNTTQRAFARAYKTIRRNASEHNYSSYAFTGMLPAYREASLITGTGRTVGQQQVVQGRITHGDLFPLISLSIQSDVEKLIRTTFADTWAKVKEVLDLIRVDLEMVHGEFFNEAHNASSQGARSDGRARPDDDEELKQHRERVADQLDSLEKELGELYDVVLELPADG